MNPQVSKASATKLETLLSTYAPVNAVAAALLRSLGPLMARAKSGKLTEPVDRRNIPAGRTLSETDASTLPGLEHVYAQFKQDLSGLGKPVGEKLFRERHGLAR